MTPSKNVGGVEGTLPIRCSPVSRLTPMTSVNVPPMSVPTTQTRFGSRLNSIRAALGA